MKFLIPFLAVVALAGCSSAPQKSAMDLQLDHLERLNAIARASQPPAIINNAPPAQPAPAINNTPQYRVPQYRPPVYQEPEPVYVPQGYIPQPPPRIYVPAGYVQDYTATYNQPRVYGPPAVRVSGWW